MYSTTAYLYHQKHRVLLIDNSGAYFDRRWKPVYSKNLKISRGVDNVLLFEFINQDQKPVNISGSTFTFRVITQDGGELLLAKEMITLSAALGRARVTITAAETDALDPQPANYSVERASGNLQEPVFVDAYADARGTVDIVDSVFPAFRASQVLTIPDQAPENETYYTSTLETTGRSLTTMQIDPAAFTGNIQAQGATTTDDEWYDIGDPVVLASSDARTYINVQGFHPLIRLELDINSGNIQQILYR